MADGRDVIIIGAGPAGLALATALAQKGMRVVVVEKCSRAVLADPPPDGRDIALTHRARGIMQQLGMWDRIAPGEISPIRGAQVEQGKSQHFLKFDPGRTGDALGYLVPNHLIRRAAYEAMQGAAGPAVELIDSAGVTGLSAHAGAAGVTLGDGRLLTAPLVVAADSRFSESRRAMGIPAHMHDFGRAVVVCRMRHELPNHGVAHECFHYGRTLAILPLNGDKCSVVLTLKTPGADALMRMSREQLAREVEQMFQHRLGRMELDGDRHRYPLVAVYARHFVAPRFALVGDAAVGMHPVTAHGYNFGLYGVDGLTRAVAPAFAAGRDFGQEEVLRGLEREHRRATLPIFLGTNALVKLYTDDRRPARVVRQGLLQVAGRLPPLKRWITRQLTDVPQPARSRH